MDLKFSQSKIEKISKKYGLSLVLAFGSQVSGKTHRNSDLDIAVMLKKDIDNYRIYSSILFGISEIFPEKKIDLVIINHANPLLLKKILEKTILLYGSKKDLLLLKIYSFKKYCDYQKYFDLEKKFVHNFIKTIKQ